MRIQEYISKLLLLAVYASFFVVQSYYIPGNNYSSAIGRLSSQENLVGSHSGKTYSDSKSGARKSSIKLNKRFHPEAVLSVSYIDLRPAPAHAVITHPNKPKDYLLISSILTDSLRGPPAIG